MTRERGHLRAIELLVDGRWRQAAQVLEDVTAAWPRDLLALQAGHQLDFFTGDSPTLRDRIARALTAWTASMPGTTPCSACTRSAHLTLMAAERFGAALASS